MKITVNVRKIEKENSRIRGIASVVLDECFAVHEIRIIEGDNGLFIAMPSIKGNDDEYHDIVQPLTKEFCEMLQDAIFESYNNLEEYKDVVLKSANPEQYPDRVIPCRIIKRSDIGSYIESIPEENKFVGYKSEPVEARVGQVGEKVLTTLMTTYEGQDYILSEVENVVKETEMEDGTKQPDIIVTNTHSTSNEEYIVRANKFPKMYEANTDGTFTPVPEPRQVALLSEDVVIETSWGELAVGLKGSYIVTYDAERQSYNTIEKGAFESTYTVQDSLSKQI